MSFALLLPCVLAMEELPPPPPLAAAAAAAKARKLELQTWRRRVAKLPPSEPLPPKPRRRLKPKPRAPSAVKRASHCGQF